MKDLKLTERHIFKGYWWLPDNPEMKVAGIVTYIPNEKICLELIGGFEESSGEYVNLLDDDNSSVPVIYGKDSDAKVITLVGCRSSFSLNFNAGFPIMSYSARMLVYGKHISSIDEICDYTAYVCFPELSYWAQPGVINQIVNYDAEDVTSSSFFIPNTSVGRKVKCFLAIVRMVCVFPFAEVPVTILGSCPSNRILNNIVICRLVVQILG